MPRLRLFPNTIKSRSVSSRPHARQCTAADSRCYRQPRHLSPSRAALSRPVLAAHPPADSARHWARHVCDGSRGPCLTWRGRRAMASRARTDQRCCRGGRASRRSACPIGRLGVGRGSGTTQDAAAGRAHGCPPSCPPSCPPAPPPPPPRSESVGTGPPPPRRQMAPACQTKAAPLRQIWRTQRRHWCHLVVVWRCLKRQELACWRIFRSLGAEMNSRYLMAVMRLQEGCH